MEFTKIGQEFLMMLLTGILGALAAFLVALVKRGFDLLSQKILEVKNNNAREKLNEALEILEMAVINTVTSLQQTAGDAIKESLANGDGKFTRKDLLSLKDQAYDLVIGQLNGAVSDILENTFDDLPELIDSMIETQVRNLKLETTEMEVNRLMINNAKAESVSFEKKEIDPIVKEDMKKKVKKVKPVVGPGTGAPGDPIPTPKPVQPKLEEK